MRLKIAALALLSIFLALPAFAQTEPTKTPWQHAAEEFFVQGSAVNTGATGTVTAVSFGWSHYATDRTEIGAVLNGLYSSDGKGYGIGPSYQFNFLPVFCEKGTHYCKGNLYIVGDAQALAGGDVTDLAAYTAATGLGMRWYMNDGAAVNLHYSYQRAVDPGAEANGSGNPLDQQGLFLRISFGVVP